MGEVSLPNVGVSLPRTCIGLEDTSREASETFSSRPASGWLMSIGAASHVDYEHKEVPSCRRSHRTCGSTARPRRPPSSTRRSSRTAASTRSSARPRDNPSTREGDVLTVEFTLAGSPFVGLNGGPDFTFNEAVSFSIDCDGPGRGRPLLGRARRGRRRAQRVRLAEGPLRRVVAGHAAPAERDAREPRPRRAHAAPWRRCWR